ncbi:hypothetical protein [Spiroplasma poulsonii]|nr:hypothetical protein [Spiroplasma poulsonii]
MIGSLTIVIGAPVKFPAEMVVEFMSYLISASIQHREVISLFRI